MTDRLMLIHVLAHPPNTTVDLSDSIESKKKLSLLCLRFQDLFHTSLWDLCGKCDVALTER